MSRGIVLAFILAGMLLTAGCASRTLAARFEEEPTISVYMHETGETRYLKLEEYVKGVVAAEMDPTWPEEALGAQAILARTFTIERIMRGRTSQGTHASTDTREFQAYNADRVNERVAQAVADTRGIVVSHEDRPVRAYFHSCSGGRTGDTREGLAAKSSPPYLAGGVTDQPCPREEISSWTASFSAAEVNQALSEIGSRPTSLTGATVARRGDSGRATVLQIGRRRVNAARFRVALDPDRMKSTLITGMRVDGGQLIISGRGWGHGVGMSQWGAFQRAERGASAEDIITAYYPGVGLTRLWD